MVKRYKNKAEAREAVWQALVGRRAARPPLPVQGRIPNFVGARAAAERLLAHPAFSTVRVIKVNPDSAQRWVRQRALERGIAVLTPTPRLSAAFRLLDPQRIPRKRYAEAASLKRGGRWGRDLALHELPKIDLIVMGSVAVTANGGRVGKGRGYADLEYGILRELGNPRVPVATTVHPEQIVAACPMAAHDVPLSIIATPERLIVPRPRRAPAGINWKQLSRKAIEEMPILAELRALLATKRRRVSRAARDSAARRSKSAPRRS